MTIRFALIIIVAVFSLRLNPEFIPSVSFAGRVQSPPTSVNVASISFSGDNTVIRDRDALPYLGRWEDDNLDGTIDFSTGERNDPICYDVDDQVQVSGVSLVVAPANSFNVSHGKVIGKVDGQDVFESANLSTQTVGTTWYIIAVNFTTSLDGADTIALWADKAITWRLEVQDPSVPGGPDVYPAGTSTHDFHFIAGLPPMFPQSQPSATPLKHTFIDLACRGANGLLYDGTNAEAIADAIFAEFSDLEVVRAQDREEGVQNSLALGYYREWDTPVTHPRLLVEEGDGQCTSWARMFIACLHIAGVNPPNEEVKVDILPWAIYQRPRLFHVKNWTAPGTTTNPDPAWAGDWPYLNVFGVKFEEFFELSTNTYAFCNPDVLDVTGVPGQGGVIDPASLFSNHVIVHVGDRLYDPSYGKHYDTSGATGDDMVIAFESQVIWGYSLLFGEVEDPLGMVEELLLKCDVDHDGDIDDDPEFAEGHLFILQANPNGNQLKVTETNR
ncbi:MAG: hypothetical protein ACR2GY_05650 [Phycisphaerales bacterium]